jgi:hypothetical protein
VFGIVDIVVYPLFVDLDAIISHYCCDDFIVVFDYHVVVVR